MINPDGSLSAWQPVAPMTNARTSLGVVAAQGRVYAVGGWDGGPLSTVETALIHADGTLGPWTLTTPLDSPVYDEGITQFNGYIYASHFDSIHRTKINPDGTLDPWITDASHLVASRDMPVLLAVNGWLYAIGGDSTLKSTERAQINSDGSLGPWSMTSSLNVARRDLSASIIDNYVYALGGWDNTTPMENNRESIYQR